jgi:gamma-glutamylcysteine synthetase
MVARSLTDVSALFPPHLGRRSTRVGLEQELLTGDLSDGSVVEIDRVRRAVAGSSYEPWVSFEPGGQVELSLPPCPTVAALDAGWGVVDRALRTDCLAAGVRLDAAPMDVARSVDQVPLQRTGERYLRMQQHFDGIGPAGRTMMRLTASTQVCLDWWPGAAGLEQWRLALLSGPLLATAFGRGPGPLCRLATWLAVDPDRTAFDDRLLAGTDPVRAYAAFAGRAGRFLDDHTQHLSTLFPPVRPRRRYLEVRYLDAQAADMVAPVVGVLATLLYDDEVRRRALRSLEPYAGSLAEQWHDAAHRPGRLADRAHHLLSLVEDSMRRPGSHVPEEVCGRLWSRFDDRSPVGAP